MYNTKHQCRYYKDDVILPDDNVTSEEADYIRNILYQEDYLNIFSINNGEKENCDFNGDFELLSKAVYNLYEKIQDNDLLKIFMKKAAANLMSDDLQLGLCILYSYDYMYLMHEFVSEYLDTGFISLVSIDKMNKLLK
jgi:hypothetical protein